MGSAPALKKKTNQKLGQPLKEKYEGARGGYYLEKVEDHLRRHNFKRVDQNSFKLEPESDPFSPSDFSSWMENALGKIGNKSESLFSLSSQVEEVGEPDE